ncbi:putative toxin-antitoxin system toxin component, PIN family [Desulfallas thermosapovorans]|uniref:Putative PIN family toxin of toxin-antitoxin system n=1 Tax=Desulfallas thermosapovorans DSM 6562 TaxID=1121431 RepID=A0A5S4ZUI4_9FIRM|nr:putative toxin-antitoxin system toxin component, PIN family [Desulfallas thermosapovorans]TYO96568.1 putative PIN family toxin of toxin-antitoxin system [Desulfallas thermosapovorans DSM 6562]
MRVVRWNGPEAAVIEMVLESKLELCLSAQILSEFYRVTQYPKFRFSNDEVDGFIGRLLPVITFITPTEKIDIVIADPDDNKIIECAVASGSSYIISGDKHLLKLGEYKGIAIIKAPDFLQLIINDKILQEIP